MTDLAVDSSDGHLVERRALLGTILESVDVHRRMCRTCCRGQSGCGGFAGMSSCVLVAVDTGALWTCSVSHGKL